MTILGPMRRLPPALRRPPWILAISTHAIDAADAERTFMATFSTVKLALVCVHTQPSAALPWKRAPSAAETAVVDIGADVDASVFAALHLLLALRPPIFSSFPATLVGTTMLWKPILVILFNNLVKCSSER